MGYDAERVGKALKERLESELPDALETVEAAWAGSDPVTLPEPATWFRGHKPTVLELESSSFPFVAVIVAETEPKSAPSRWGYQEEELPVFVDYFVVADDEATVNKRVHRYAEALLTVLQEERVVEGYQQRDYRPRVRLSEASRHAKTRTADMLVPVEGDEDFIQMGRIQVTFDGG
jgi:hypothetical protein